MMILPYLMRVVPARLLMEMCITGELISARQALGVGIVNYVVPPTELDSKEEWLLERVVSRSTTGVRLGKLLATECTEARLMESKA